MSATLHHVVEGPADAPVLVLGNPLGTTLASWDGVVGALRERFRLVRYDHRGQGDSPLHRGPFDIADLGRDVVALLDALRIERAAYCGVSLGGMVGLWLAAHASERIVALGALCTSAYPGNPGAWAERASVVTKAGTTAPIVESVVGRWVTPVFASDHPVAVAGLRAMLRSSPPAGYASCCGLLERLDLRAALPLIEAPTLVVSGAQDTALPPHHGELVARMIRGARFEVLDPAAHLPTVERPDAVADLILEHLGERP